MPEFVHHVVEAIWSFLPSEVHNMISEDTVHSNSGESQNSSIVGENTLDDSVFNNSTLHETETIQETTNIPKISVIDSSFTTEPTPRRRAKPSI